MSELMDRLFQRGAHAPVPVKPVPEEAPIQLQPEIDPDYAHTVAARTIGASVGAPNANTRVVGMALDHAAKNLDVVVGAPMVIHRRIVLWVAGVVAGCREVVQASLDGHARKIAELTERIESLERRGAKK